MSKCDMCGDHIVRRFKLIKNDQVPLVNIPQNIIKKLTNDDLEYIKTNASIGIDVCRQCKRECMGDFKKCSMTIIKDGRKTELTPQYVKNLIVNQRLIDNKFIQDKKVIEDINSEQNRRSGIIKSLAELQKLPFPQVPTHTPK